MKKIIFLIPIVLFFSCSSIAQNPQKMEKQIKKTVKGYIQAGDDNDAKALDNYLQENFRVALYDQKEDIIKILDKKTYRTLIENKTFGGYPRSANFHSIEMIGENMATVQVTLTSPGKPTLKNFYSLAKTGKDWFVVQDFVTMIP